jgi:hypothetical protein
MNDPNITISENSANVFVKTNHGAHFNVANNFTMVKDNNKWLIMKVE